MYKKIILLSRKTSPPPILEKCAEDTRYRIAKRSGLYSRPIKAIKGVYVKIDEKWMLCYSICDYLGLAQDEQIMKTAQDTIGKYGTSVSGSRITSGTTERHELLEKKLADFLDTEDCIVFTLGYMVNTGVIPALVTRREVLIVDRASHACIVDGARIALAQGAIVRRYSQNDMSQLENILQQTGDSVHRLIVSDSLYSMEGHTANLPKMHELGSRFNAGILLDDSHGFGVMGNSGRGTTEHYGMLGQFDLVMGTLSKAVPGIGGFVAGKKEYLDFLRYNTSTYIFTVALPPIYVETAIKALEIIKSQTERRDQLWDKVNYMKTALLKLGFDIGKTESAIIPIYIRDDNKTFILAKKLQKAGIIVDAMLSPGVPAKTSRLRLIITIRHTKENFDKTLKVLEREGKKLKIIS